MSRTPNTLCPQPAFPDHPIVASGYCIGSPIAPCVTIRPLSPLEIRSTVVTRPPASVTVYLTTRVAICANVASPPSDCTYFLNTSAGGGPGTGTGSGAPLMLSGVHPEKLAEAGDGGPSGRALPR